MQYAWPVWPCQLELVTLHRTVGTEFGNPGSSLIMPDFDLSGELSLKIELHMLRPITEKVHSGNGPVSLVRGTYSTQRRCIVHVIHSDQGHALYSVTSYLGVLVCIEGGHWAIWNNGFRSNSLFEKKIGEDLVFNNALPKSLTINTSRVSKVKTKIA